MENTQSIRLPAYTIGPQAYQAFVETVRPLGRRVLLTGGEKALQAGRKAVEDAMEGSSLELAGVFLYGEDCTFQAAQALASKAKAVGAEVIAGMGGGRALDTAKACGHLLNLPVVTLPTIAATCASVTALSVMYREDGTFDRFLFLSSPPAHAFIHTGIIAKAPFSYLRAGMGDSIAKHVESTFSAKNDTVSHADAMGLAIGKTCYEPLMRLGVKALADCERGIDSPELREAILSIIVSTGLVSILVKDAYNGALAHSLYYALESHPAIRRCLHGDVVAYGVLVQLVLDGQLDEMERVYNFLARLRVPLSLAAMGINPEAPDFDHYFEEIVGQPDMAHLPYPITPAMVRAAIKAVEDYDAAHGAKLTQEVLPIV